MSPDTITRISQSLIQLFTKLSLDDAMLILDRVETAVFEANGTGS
jgi:hypothetical protein